MCSSTLQKLGDDCRQDLSTALLGYHKIKIMTINFTPVEGLKLKRSNKR